MLVSLPVLVVDVFRINIQYGVIIYIGKIINNSIADDASQANFYFLATREETKKKKKRNGKEKEKRRPLDRFFRFSPFPFPTSLLLRWISQNSSSQEPSPKAGAQRLYLVVRDVLRSLASDQMSTQSFFKSSPKAM